MIMSGGFSLIAGGQEPEGMVKYTPDFRFTDGIYLDFEQVRTNKPIPKAKILTSTDYNDKEFFKNLFAGDKIYYYDALGIRQEIEKIRYGDLQGMAYCIYRYRAISTG